MLDYLVHMKALAKECRGRGRRVSYSDEDKVRALEFVEEVETTGGTLEDAADLLSMHRSTLMGWLERATAPDSKGWPRVEVHVHLHGW